MVQVPPPARRRPPGRTRPNRGARSRSSYAALIPTTRVAGRSPRRPARRWRTHREEQISTVSFDPFGHGGPPLRVPGGPARARAGARPPHGGQAGGMQQTDTDGAGSLQAVHGSGQSVAATPLPPSAPSPLGLILGLALGMVLLLASDGGPRSSTAPRPSGRARNAASMSRDRAGTLARIMERWSGLSEAAVDRSWRSFRRRGRWRPRRFTDQRLSRDGARHRRGVWPQAIGRQRRRARRARSSPGPPFGGTTRPASGPRPPPPTPRPWRRRARRCHGSVPTLGTDRGIELHVESYLSPHRPAKQGDWTDPRASRRRPQQRPGAPPPRLVRPALLLAAYVTLGVPPRRHDRRALRARDGPSSTSAGPQRGSAARPRPRRGRALQRPRGGISGFSTGTSTCSWGGSTAAPRAAAAALADPPRFAPADQVFRPVLRGLDSGRAWSPAVPLVRRLPVPGLRPSELSSARSPCVCPSADSPRRRRASGARSTSCCSPTSRGQRSRGSARRAGESRARRRPRQRDRRAGSSSSSSRADHRRAASRRRRRRARAAAARQRPRLLLHGMQQFDLAGAPGFSPATAGGELCPGPRSPGRFPVARTCQGSVFPIVLLGVALLACAGRASWSGAAAGVVVRARRRRATRRRVEPHQCWLRPATALPIVSLAGAGASPSGWRWSYCSAGCSSRRLLARASSSKFVAGPGHPDRGVLPSTPATTSTSEGAVPYGARRAPHDGFGPGVPAEVAWRFTESTFVNVLLRGGFRSCSSSSPCPSPPPPRTRPHDPDDIEHDALARVLVFRPRHWSRSSSSRRTSCSRPAGRSLGACRVAGGIEEGRAMTPRSTIRSVSPHCSRFSRPRAAALVPGERPCRRPHRGARLGFLFPFVSRPRLGQGRLHQSSLLHRHGMSPAAS